MAPESEPALLLDRHLDGQRKLDDHDLVARYYRKGVIYTTLFRDPMFDRSTFAQRLTEAIDDSPLTHVAVAAKLGVKPNRVSEWVNARGVPKLHQAVALASLLDVSLDWLLTGEQTASPAEHKLVGELAGLAPSLSRLATRARSLTRP